MDKINRDGEKKKKEFIGASPVRPCQNSLWTMSFRIYEKERNPDSPAFTR